MKLIRADMDTYTPDGNHGGRMVVSDWSEAKKALNCHDDLLSSLKGLIEWAQRIQTHHPSLAVRNAVAAVEKAEGRGGPRMTTHHAQVIWRLLVKAPEAQTCCLLHQIPHAPCNVDEKRIVANFLRRVGDALERQEVNQQEEP